MQKVNMVEAAGFHPVEAMNADDAIEILETRDDIRAIFTGVQMPGSMDGLKLASAVRDRWPPVAIIATSGLTGVGAKDLPPGCRFLSKPYAAADLAKLLRELTA